MAIATSGKEVLAKFFDEGAYQELYAQAPVSYTHLDVYKRQAFYVT